MEALPFDEGFEPNKHGEITHYIFLVFYTRYVSGDLVASDDIVELQWFPKNDLPLAELNKPSLKLFKKIGYIPNRK
jgi:8-oxo-dGTP pyrophosphatase MutT (NUDIX family)